MSHEIEQSLIKMYCRSSCVPNPGAGGYAIIIENSNGAIHDPIIGGIVNATNYQAEETGLQECITWAHKNLYCRDDAKSKIIVYTKYQALVNKYNRLNHKNMVFEFINDDYSPHAKQLAMAVALTLHNLKTKGE